MKSLGIDEPVIRTPRMGLERHYVRRCLGTVECLTYRSLRRRYIALNPDGFDIHQYWSKDRLLQGKTGYVW